MAFNETRVSIRPTTLADLDALVQNGESCFAEEPANAYRYPDSHNYRVQRMAYARQNYQKCLESSDSGDHPCMVAEVADPDEPNRHKSHRVQHLGEALFHLRTRQLRCRSTRYTEREQYFMHVPLTAAILLVSKQSKLDRTKRPDADQNRIAHYVAARDGVQSKLDQIYGSKQRKLYNVKTHPEFRRLGAAGMLVRWSLERAEAGSLVITILASAQGRVLYEHLGFDYFQECTAQVEGEPERLILHAMVYDPKKSTDGGPNLS